MKTFVLLLALACSSCAAVSGVTPSLEYCSKVNYQRDGNATQLTATCQAPIGAALLH